MISDFLSEKLQIGIKKFARRMETVEPGVPYVLTRAKLGCVTLFAGLLKSEFAMAVTDEKAMLIRALSVNLLYNQWGFMLTLIDQTQKNYGASAGDIGKVYGAWDYLDLLCGGVHEEERFERKKLLDYASDLQAFRIKQAEDFIALIQDVKFPNNLKREFLDQLHNALQVEATQLKDEVGRLSRNTRGTAPEFI